MASHGLNGGVVDLNSIPLAAVDRIEVLKDGASSLYGTDAIGGVINFILRRDFTGVSVQGRYRHHRTRVAATSSAPRWWRASVTLPKTATT